MWGAIASAAGSVLGGILDRNSASDARHDDAVQRDIDRQLQKDFAQQGIRWKVDDAKAAGLHPLYAIGANTTSYQPVSIGGSSGGGSTYSDMGQNIGRALQAQQTSEERELHDAQVALLRAQARKENSFADASVLESEAARNRLAAEVSGPFPAFGFGNNPDNARGMYVGELPLPPRGRDNAQANPVGSVRIKPDEQISRRPGSGNMTAGDHPYLMEVQVGRDSRRKILLPKADDMGDMDIPVGMWPSIIAANVERYGFLNSIRNAFAGYGGENDDVVSRFIQDMINKPSTRGRYSHRYK